MDHAKQTQRQVYLSGQMVPESEAKISIFDSAIMLGDCLTESTRTFRHKPFIFTLSLGFFFIWTLFIGLFYGTLT